MGSERLPPSDRRAAAVTPSLMALTSLPPSGTSPASASPGSQADLDRHERHVIRLLPTWGHHASRAPHHQTGPGLHREIAPGNSSPDGCENYSSTRRITP